MIIMFSKKDTYGVMFEEYPDVVTAEKMSEMLVISMLSLITGDL